MLLEHPGRVVTREELQQRIWPSDTFVDFDRGLYNAIKKLREALGDSAESPRFIETLSRRGYRFIAAVEENGHAAAVPAPTLEATRPATTATMPHFHRPAVSLLSSGRGATGRAPSGSRGGWLSGAVGFSGGVASETRSAPVPEAA